MLINIVLAVAKDNMSHLQDMNWPRNLWLTGQLNELGHKHNVLRFNDMTDHFDLVTTLTHLNTIHFNLLK